jgi:quinol monooxygenase YgiN
VEAVSPLVVLVEFLIKRSFAARFADLIDANAKASLESERGCRRFDVLFDPKEPRRFILYEIYDNEAAFDEHLASSHYLAFAAAIENAVEHRSVRRLSFRRETAPENIAQLTA